METCFLPREASSAALSSALNVEKNNKTNKNKNNSGRKELAQLPANLIDSNYTHCSTFLLCLLMQILRADSDFLLCKGYKECVRPQANRVSPSNTFLLCILFSHTNSLHVLFHNIHKYPLWSFSTPPACQFQISASCH